MGEGWHAVRHYRRGGWVLAAVLLLCGAVRVQAVERWYLVSNADAIVAGQLEWLWRVPWFDGWHLGGTVRVSQSVRGEVRAGERMAFKFLYSCCEAKTVLRPHACLWGESIWLLTRLPNAGWTSAGTCDDIGWRPLSDLPSLRERLGSTGAEAHGSGDGGRR